MHTIVCHGSDLHMMHSKTCTLQLGPDIFRLYMNHLNIPPKSPPSPKPNFGSLLLYHIWWISVKILKCSAKNLNWPGREHTRSKGYLKPLITGTCSYLCPGRARQRSAVQKRTSCSKKKTKPKNHHYTTLAAFMGPSQWWQPCRSTPHFLSSRTEQGYVL